MFIGSTFDRQLVKPEFDGAVYAALFNDGCLQGCEISTRPNEIVVAPGAMVCCGRVIPNDGNQVIPVLNPNDGFLRLLLQIDLSGQATADVFEQVSTVLQYSTSGTFPALTREDVNNGGIVYQMVLGIYRVQNGQITEILRKNRKARSKAEVPVGATINYTSLTPPEGWFLGNGAAVSRFEYAELFELYGTTFGAGDGVTTFNLPNTVNRFLLGCNANLGGTGGAATHTLTVSQIPYHVHQKSDAFGPAWNVGSLEIPVENSFVHPRVQVEQGGWNHSPTSTHGTGDGTSFNKQPPYLQLPFIIKT